MLILRGTKKLRDRLKSAPMDDGAVSTDGSTEAGSGLGDTTQPRRRSGNVICRYYEDASGEPVNPWNLPPELNGLQVQVPRMSGMMNPSQRTTDPSVLSVRRCLMAW